MTEEEKRRLPPFNRVRVASALIGFVSIFALVLAASTPLTLLFDGDSYFHLALGRDYAAQGYSDHLRWARLSILEQTYGDKELLFHWILAPFANSESPISGAYLALALLNGLVGASIGYWGARAIGPVGALLPLLLYVSSTDFLLRMFRLRPEILSLIIMLNATGLAAARRYIGLFILSALFALSYTAFQAYLGLALGWFAIALWWERRPDFRLLIVPAAGVLLGVLIHPGFPSNLRIWEVQNFQFFQMKDQLDVGTEIGPLLTSDFLRFEWGWLLALLVLWRSSTAAEVQRSEADQRSAGFFLVNAVAFSLLFIKFQRFATYAVPFVTLALVTELRRRNLGLGRWTRVAGLTRLPSLAALVVCLLSSLSTVTNALPYLAPAAADQAKLDRIQGVADAIPDGAKVAAGWSDAHYLIWRQPKARYLNVLDPIFMVLRAPKQYESLRLIEAGREPDPPLALGMLLSSEYLFTHRRPGRAQTRLERDPRVTLIAESNSKRLYRIHSDRNQAFVLDWLRPSDSLPYPRLEPDKGGRYEGYVDLRRFSDRGSCVEVVHRFELEDPDYVGFELAPFGPTTMSLDDEDIVDIPANLFAVLGDGVTFVRPLVSGTHEIRVRTCEAYERIGFYLARKRLR